MTTRHWSDSPGFVLWLTGLSGAGKSTLARTVTADLAARGHRVELLDGDEVRTNLTQGLGFSRADRDTNIARIGYVAGKLAKHGVAVVVAAISPYREARDKVRASVDNFVEVFVDAPLETCVQRDPKGLYAKAIAGEISNFTGVSDPYEPPLDPELVVHTADEPVAGSAGRIVACLESSGLTKPLDDGYWSSEAAHRRAPAGLEERHGTRAGFSEVGRRRAPAGLRSDEGAAGDEGATREAGAPGGGGPPSVSVKEEESARRRAEGDLG